MLSEKIFTLVVIPDLMVALFDLQFQGLIKNKGILITSLVQYCKIKWLK